MAPTSSACSPSSSAMVALWQEGQSKRRPLFFSTLHPDDAVLKLDLFGNAQAKSSCQISGFEGSPWLKLSKTFSLVGRDAIPVSFTRTTK